VEIALEILDPEILLKPTHLTGYAVRIIGCCLYKLQEGEHIGPIIERNIAILIVNLIGPDNPQLAVDCSFFASLATYCSNAICFQLCEADVFNVIGGALREGGIFHNCGLNCLNALYNCLVACPGKAADAFESEPLREILAQAIESGSAKVKQSALDIVSFLIATANLPNVIDCAKRFDMFGQISLVIELGLTETIPHVLAAANRIIEALEIAPHHVEEARSEMVSKDVIDALTSVLESTAEPQVLEYARAYLAWATR
jgi:hypothetical protein